MKSIRAPFWWAKILVVLFSLSIIIETSWFILNAQVGHTALVLTDLRNVPQGIYVAVFGAFITTLVFSWYPSSSSCPRFVLLKI